MPTPNTDCKTGNELRAVAAVGTQDVWAVGVATHGDTASEANAAPLIEHLTGSGWKVISTPSVPDGAGELDAVTAVDAHNVWAVGSYVGPNRGALQTLIEHWDGSAWSIVSSPNPDVSNDNSLHAVVAINSHDVWAGGLVGTFLPQAPLLLHWDGTSWSNQTGAPPPSRLFGRWVSASVYGLATTASGDVWAVGSVSDESGGDAAYTLAEHLSGASWSLTPSVDVRTNPTLSSLKAVAAFPSDVWAVGPHSLMEHWDGMKWSLLTPPIINVTLNATAGTSSTDLWAVGSNGNAVIEHWDGHQWAVVQPPADIWTTPPAPKYRTATVDTGTVTVTVDATGGSATPGANGTTTITASVQSNQVRLLLVGQRVNVTPDGSTQTTTGTLSSIAPETGVDVSTTRDIVVTVPSGSPIQLGSFPTIAIVIQQVASVPTVPTSAVYSSGGQAYVRVLVNGAPHDVPVTIGVSDSHLTQIVSGVSLGDVIVISQSPQD